MQQRLLFCLTLFIFICHISHAQNAKVWALIPNQSDVPYVGSDNVLTSNNAVFNAYIQQLGIISCTKALPSSKSTRLQKVYELSATSNLNELIFTLTNQVPAVERVERAPVYDTLHIPNDYNNSLGVNNYALNLINAPAAWDLTTGDSSVVIAITDQGYDPLHSELSGKYIHFNSGSNLTTHGNAVSILAAGRTNNNNGLSSIGYNCKLGLYAMNYNEMLNAAYAGARVINMSWSSGCFFNTFEQQCIDEAYDAGAFLVAAAGNGNTCGIPSAYVYPAAYDHVFSVTSIGDSNNHEQIPNDSTSTHQHNDMVDLSAPGYWVAVNPAEGWYFNSSGTSFAAPYVSGTIGLMLSRNPCLSRKDIDTILRLSAFPLDSLNPNYIGLLGAGRLDAHAAVQMATNWTTQPMVVNAQPVSVTVPAGTSAQFTVSSSSSFPLYQWQRDSSGIFVNLSNNSTYSGVKTATLFINNITAALNNQQYRCVMTSGYCQAISDPAALVVNGAVLPEDPGPIHGATTLCFGDTAIFHINPVNYATGYNWSFTGNVNIISGINTNTVIVQIFDTVTQATVTPYNGNGSGNSATMTVNTIPLPTGFLSGNSTVCAGDTAVLTLTATGQGPWFGVINDSIIFNGVSSPMQITVYPDSTTYYILQTLATMDGCKAYPDYLGSTANVTVLPLVRDTIYVAVCSSQFPYSWNGVNYSSAGLYIDTIPNTNGCDTIRTLQLTIMPLLRDTIHVAVCSSQLPYAWNGVNYSSAGMFTDTIPNSNGCDTIRTLHLTVISGTVPLTPASITQVLVSNTCYSRVYRYTAAVTANSTGYQWTIPNSCGGIPGVTVDSGDINSSRIIKLSYYSNAAALLTDSIRVRAYNSCGSGPKRSAKLINTALNVPALPSITATSLVSNVCGARRVRYTASNLPLATSTATAATGYLWSFTNPVPLQAQLDSGTWSSKVIVIKYLSNSAALPGDSIYLQYASACGYSLKRALKINLTALNPPTAPASIIITTLTASVCGNRRYRFTMPVMPNATTTSGAGTGYLWTPTGNLAAYGVVDSGSLTSRIVVIRYTDDNASVVGDSMKAQFNSDCGYSSFRALKFSATKLNPPLAPASITITSVAPTVCGARIYRYTAPNLPTGTTTLAAPTGYEWSFVGSLGSNAVIDSGTVNSKVIRVRFTSNAGASTGDSVKLRYPSSCGYSPYKANKLTNTFLTNCPPPVAILRKRYITKKGVIK